MLKKLIAPVAVSGALLGSLVVGGAAYAAAPTTAAPAAAHAAAHHTDGKARTWWKAHRRSIRAKTLAVSAATIGITPKALATELRTGKSIAQVAAEHNVSAASVIGALTSAADAKVATAVKAGKLTQAQAGKVTAALPARITKAVNHVF
ncbi:MAG TPA: hypothetical protein VND44_06260 [Acidimicrobiales bacterium]|nr:hypothetical protein [Acidimicrobiales bacterium]